jgi:hypothetical protein
MAKFSRTFLQGLLQPSYQEGLFTAAQGIGQAPQMRALQQQQQAELQRFDQVSKTTGQAQTSVFSGDPNALTYNIKQLEALRDAAPTLKEKQTIDSRITQLRNLTGTAEARGLKRDITAVSQIDNTLETLDTSTEQGKKVKEALEARKTQLLQNPEIEQGYRQAQVDEFKFLQTEAVIREQEYLRNPENQKIFQDAIQSGDKDRLSTVLDAVPNEFKAVANEYITGAIRNNEVMSQFNERSIAMNKAPMTDTEIDALVNSLPEDVRTGIALEVDAYKEASKGWSDKTQWSGSTVAYTTAKQAEKALRQKAASLSERALFLDITENRSIAAQNRAIIQEAELRMLDRPSDLDIERRAKMITTNKDGEASLVDRANALSQLTQENIEDQLQKINSLDPERAKELGYEAVDISKAVQILTENPSEENKQLFIRLYGSEAFAEWQTKNEDIAEEPVEQGVLDIAVGVPVRAVGGAVQRNIVEPVLEAVTLGGARKAVGKAFRVFGGDLSSIPLEELQLVVNDTSFSKKNRDKVQKEINKRQG